MKFKILSIPSNLLRYLLKLKKNCGPVRYPSLSPFRIRIKSREAKSAKVRAQSRHASSIERFQSVRQAGRLFSPFPLSWLGEKSLGHKVYPRIPGSAHNRASKDSREFRAVAPSRREHSRFQLLLRGGIKKWAALWM